MLWQGETASPEAVHSAVGAARLAFAPWACAPHEERLGVVRAFADELQSRQQDLAEAIASETGKPLWEARQEVGSMAAKVELSVRAQAERAGERQERTGFGQAVLRHRPHGVLAVLGPYNFPGHLPGGHIVPALLAGNAVVFKPSEETPLTGEIMARLWHDAGLPDRVLTVVQGRRETGEALVASDIDGVLFTGSASTGALLRRALVDRPGVILALEMGGNNPLIAWDGDVDAAASIIVQSAFITTGQRCSCARRLIVPTGPFGDAVVSAVADLSSRLRIGHWRDDPEPGLGPLISATAADRVRNAADALAAAGARTIKSLARVEGRSPAFVTPAIYDVTG
ncbi:MAG TPA: aldehyde dehydrogenase family protein, partial [Novosphingobium sp.]